MKSGDRYSFPAMTLHWLMAVLIIGGFFLGLYSDQLALSPLKLRTIQPIPNRLRLSWTW